MSNKNERNQHSTAPTMEGKPLEFPDDPLSGDNYRDFYRHNPHAILVVGRNGKFLCANPAAETLSGYTSAELKQMSFSALSPPDKLKENQAYFEEDVQGSRRDFETVMVRKDGQQLDIRVTGVPLMCEQGVAGLYAIVEDVTESKRTERARASQFAEIEGIYANAPVGLSLVDTDLRYLRINNLLAEMNGKPAAEHIGNTIGDMTPEIEDIVVPIYRQVIESGQPVLNVELRGTTQADPENIHYWIASLFPTKSASGTVQGVVASVQDVTQTRQAYEMLQESEGRYRSLFENMQNGFALHEMVFDEAGQPVDYIFLDVNEPFEAQTTLKREDIIGRRVTEVLPGIEDDPADWIGTYGRVVLSGNSYTFENYSEALDRWYSVVAYRPNEGQFAVVFVDITERKRAEQENTENRVQLKSLASELVLAEERERNRIAVHLHDDVGQNLAYAKMQLQMVRATLDDPSQQEDVTEVCDILTRRNCGWYSRILYGYLFFW